MYTRHRVSDEALRTAFPIATDATGVLVQQLAGGDQKRAGKRGHFFVQIADADHVFFEYTERETSAVVAELFAGFSGYVLADAKSVHGLLFHHQGPRRPTTMIRRHDSASDDGRTAAEGSVL